MTIAKETPTARVWADGFGRWHAVVADSPLGLTRAVDAIAAELAERAPAGQTLPEIIAYVHSNIVSIPGAGPGLVHFAEYEIA